MPKRPGRWRKWAAAVSAGGTGVLMGAAAGTVIPVLGTTGGAVAGGLFGFFGALATFPDDEGGDDHNAS